MMLSGTRKLVAIGASIFGSLALATTGVAAFVVSLSTRSGVDGEVRVAIINDVTARFEDIDFVGTEEERSLGINNKFCFDARLEDNTGRFRYTEDEHQTYEHLRVTLSATVLPVKFVDSVTLRLGANTQWNANVNPIQDAVELGYLALVWDPKNTGNATPISWSDPNNFMVNEVTVPLGEVDPSRDSCSFKVTYGFAWGPYFGWMNPTRFYDESAGTRGSALSTREVLNEMDAFVRVMHYGKEYMDINKPLPNGFTKSDESALTFTTFLKTNPRV